MTDPERERIEALIESLDTTCDIMKPAGLGRYVGRIREAIEQLRADHPAQGERTGDDLQRAWQAGVEALRNTIINENDETQGYALAVESGYWDGAKSYLQRVQPLCIHASPAPARTEATPAQDEPIRNVPTMKDLQALAASNNALRAALLESDQALDDWTATYASDMCDDMAVENARARISGGGGTLAYIAWIHERNRAALELRKPPLPIAPTQTEATPAEQGGDGATAATSRPTIKCSRCNGAGVLIVDDPASNHMVCSKPCERCAGIGRIPVDVMGIVHPSLAAQAEAVDLAVQRMPLHWGDHQPQYKTDERAALSAAAATLAAVPGLVALLTELHALVWGECPSLLNEDSGGCARLDLGIRAALRAVGGEGGGT